MSAFSKLQYYWNRAKDSVVAWMDDYAPSMGAALAFYTVFSIGPLLIIVIAVAGLVFGQAAAQGEIVTQLRQLLGEEGAVAVQGMLKSVSDPARRGTTFIHAHTDAINGIRQNAYCQDYHSTTVCHTHVLYR